MYEGASPWRDLYVQSKIVEEMGDLMGSQCRLKGGSERWPGFRAR